MAFSSPLGSATIPGVCRLTSCAISAGTSLPKTAALPCSSDRCSQACTRWPGRRLHMVVSPKQESPPRLPERQIINQNVIRMRVGKVNCRVLLCLLPLWRLVLGKTWPGSLPDILRALYKMGLESGQLSQAVVDELSSRLAASADLRLPGQLTKAGSEPPSENKRKEYLSALLLRDPGELRCMMAWQGAVGVPAGRAVARSSFYLPPQACFWSGTARCSAWRTGQRSSRCGATTRCRRHFFSVPIAAALVRACAPARQAVPWCPTACATALLHATRCHHSHRPAAVSSRLLPPYKEMPSCPPPSTLQVDFYLKLLEDREDSQKQGTAAKNRRLAYMNRWGAPVCGRAGVPLTPLLRTAAAAGAQQLPRAEHPAPRIHGYLRLLQPGHADLLPARPPPAGCCRRALSSRTRR